MATYAYTTDVVTNATNVGAVTLAELDVLYVGNDASLIATGTNSDGVRGARNSTITVNGEIFGNDDGIQITTLPNFGSGHVTINQSGSISGGTTAIHMTGISGTVVNAGTLAGYHTVLFEDGDASVVNTGIIQANSLGEAIRFNDGGNALANYGFIVNSGSNAIFGGLGTDSITNYGVIDGSVILQDGDDRFINRGTVSGSVDGGAGNDTMIGGPGDNFFGSVGDDIMRGAESMSGGDGDDRLVSLYSSELVGGLGRDILVGADGADTFRFAESGNSKFDHIRKFGNFDNSSVDDVIELDHAYFNTLALGELAAAAFHVGAAATTAAQRIIFDDTTGTVWYDKDGTGAANATRVAIIDTFSNPAGPSLSQTDFLVV